MALSHPTVVVRAVFPLAVVVLLPIASWAGADGASAKYRQAMDEARGSKARLEMALLPEVVRRFEASKEQEKRSANY